MTKATKLQNKSSVELADILKAHIGDYQKKYQLFPEQYKIVYDLLNCRTAYLGGHIDRCTECGKESISYNSCRNRHCPKCQSLPREKWIANRGADVLPVKYFHNVFTLPHELNPIILANKKVMFNILFKAVSETLLSFGENPQNRLKGKLGFISVLHTWDQLLKSHFHLHCLIPGGAISKDLQSWRPCKNRYLFNIEALSLVFRGKFIEHMKAAYKNDTLCFKGILAPFKKPERFGQLVNSLYRNKWVVYGKKSMNRPEFVIKYLGRYAYRIAISNQRIVSLNKGVVTINCKNRKTNMIVQKKIPAVEFIRRFLLHAVPPKFIRIRHYGFLASRNKKEYLGQIRKITGCSATEAKHIEASVQEMMLELTGIDILLCPECRKGEMEQVHKIPVFTGQSADFIIRPPNTKIPV
ncbi:MAG: IS91 family transposase [Desulfobacteraceae bacterium]|nr:IS91 family transposase [Desulfobacteraceae bacterium]